MLTLMGIMTFSSCKKSEITKDYPSLKKTKNIVQYVNIDEVFEIMKLNDNKNYIVTFGFKSCQWCQAAIPYINDIALEKGYNVVRYLDIKAMRDDEKSLEHSKYIKLFEKIKDDIGNPSRINAPTVVVINNGRVIGYHEGTTDDHVKIDGNLPIMTEEQKNKLKDIYRVLF